MSDGPVVAIARAKFGQCASPASDRASHPALPPSPRWSRSSLARAAAVCPGAGSQTARHVVPTSPRVIFFAFTLSDPLIKICPNRFAG